MSGDLDISTCIVCAGRGRVNCQFCGGRGSVFTQGPSSRGGRGRGRGGKDLRGHWTCQTGTWYEFTGNDPNYDVIEGGPMGQTGQGSAVRSGDRVRLSANNVVAGPYEVELHRKGDSLHGTFSFYGITMDADFYRD